MTLPPTCWRAVAVLAAVPLLVAAPTSTSAARSPDQAEWLEIEVVGIERLDHSTQLILELHNTRDTTGGYAGLSDLAYGRAEGIGFNDLSGIRLLDSAANVEYLPLHDIDTLTCICSQLRAFDADETLRVWWRSAPLPDTVTEVDVLGPDGATLATGVEVEA
jgi:hypothetical protein